MFVTLIGLWAAAAAPAVDVGPLSGQRQVGVEERLPRILELLAMDAGVVAPMQGGPFPVERAVELVERLWLPGAVPLWENGPLWWDPIRGPLSLSAAEEGALRFDLRSFALYAADGIALQLSLFGGPEVYARGSAVDVGPPWEMRFKERLPVAGVDGKCSWHLFADVEAWGRATLDLAQDPNLYTMPQPRAVATNVVAFDSVDVTFPHRALVGVGGGRWSLDLGRDRLEVGNGRLGNLLLGDSADFHDFVRAQLFLPQFTWTSLIVRLDPSLIGDEASLPGMDALRSQEKHLVLHRAELVLLEKLHLAVSEGWLVGGVPLDLRQLNPLLIFHNQFAWNDVDAYKSASILVTLEATLVPVRGLRLWGQYGVNQLQSKWEQERFPEASAVIADATGALAGIEYTIPVALFTPRVSTWVKPAGVVHLFGGAEFVETSPWFGVRENPLTSWASRRRWSSNLTGNIEIVEQPLGWRFGPDSRVWRVWLGGLDVGLGQLEVGYEQRLKGEQTLSTPYVESTAAVALRTPSGTAELQRVLTVQAELLPLRWERFSASLRLDWRHYWIDNARHVNGVRLVDDQLALGIRLDL